MIGRYWPPALVALLFLYRLTDHSIAGVWQDKWQLLTVLLLGIAVMKAALKLQNITFMFCASALFCNLLLVGNQEPLIRYYVYSYAFTLFAAIFCLFQLSFDELRRVLTALSWAGLALAACVCIQFIIHPILITTRNSVWVFGNPAMCGAFLAFTISFFRLPFQLFILAAILMTGSYTATVAAVISLLISNWNRLKVSKLIPLLSLILTACVLILPVGKLATGNGRYPLWANSFSWWFHNHLIYWVTGTGAGTYGALSRTIALESSPTATAFPLWLHSDWLQILFEQGLIGIMAAIAIFLIALKKSIYDLKILGAILAYSVVMTTQFPWHWPIHALFGMVLLAITFREDA